MSDTKREPRPTLRLVGHSSHAVAIMNSAAEALRRAGASPEHIERYRAEATSGDYDHLLAVTMRYCRVV